MEKTQDQIHLENLENRYAHGWYNDYPFKSIGNIIHWLYVYGYQNYDTAIIGEKKVWTGLSQKEVIATFIWQDELQMPIFDFEPRFSWLAKEQEFYIDKIMRHLTAERMFLDTLPGKINLNQKIMVKLTAHGKELYYLYFQKIRFPIVKKQKPNVVGYMSFQLWEFMSIFGGSMYNGAQDIIERNIIYWEGEKKEG